MNSPGNALECCRAFIDSNIHESQLHKLDRVTPVVTFSRLAEIGAHDVALELMPLLEKEWGTFTLFDKNLVEKVLEDHHLPERLRKYMPEDRDHEVSGLINEILGLHPSLWQLFHYTCDTLHKLASMGNVILIGRGSHIIARNHPHTIHVRLICPDYIRIPRVMEQMNLSAKEAKKRLQAIDSARAAYVKSHFDEDIADQMTYDLILNMEHFNAASAAAVIAQSVSQSIKTAHLATV